MSLRFRSGLLAIAGLSLLLPLKGCGHSNTAAGNSPNTTASERAPESVASAGASAEGSGDEIPQSLIGRWSPQSYLTPEGDTVDLTELPADQQQDLAWELTADGTIRIGNLEGTYSVDGNTIYATNPDSGDVTEFEFSVTDDRLSVEKRDDAEAGVLELTREGESATPEG